VTPVLFGGSGRAGGRLLVLESAAETLLQFYRA